MLGEKLKHYIKKKKRKVVINIYNLLTVKRANRAASIVGQSSLKLPTSNL